jgi:DNA-binding response OmpR family regulator
MNQCPTCGRYANEHLPPCVDTAKGTAMIGGHYLSLRPMTARVLALLVERWPSSVTRDELLFWLYRGSSEPENAENCLCVYIRDLRAALVATPARIETWHWNGYRLVLPSWRIARPRVGEMLGTEV